MTDICVCPHCGWRGPDEDVNWHTIDVPGFLEDSYQEDYWVPYCPNCGRYMGEEND